MAGNQFGFNFSSDEDVDNLLISVTCRLEDYLSAYNLSEDSIVYVQISFRQKDNKLLSEFSLDKPSHIPNTDLISTEKIISLPVSINEDSIGKPLDVTVSNNIITNISLNIKGNEVNFLDIIKSKAKSFGNRSHKDNITSFDEDYKFYLLRDKHEYVLAIKTLTTDSVDKIKYSLDGVILNHVTNLVVNNLILRNSGNKQVIISDNKIVSSIQDIELKPIEKPESKTMFVENDNIGVIDIETYKAKDNTYKVYALGFKTNLYNKPIIYYLNANDLDSYGIVLSLVDELLRSKYSNITFYCHNLGGYDIVFILKVLYAYNDSINYVKNKDEAVNNHKYVVNCILRDDIIIKVKITKGKNSFIILDSYAMLPQALSKLGDNFGVTTIKSKFPYKFAVEDHLFYEGPMPSIDMYDNISLVEYNDISVYTWSFKEETIKYLTNDLLSLHEILTVANKRVFLDYNINMTESMTISGLAVRLYLKDYYLNNILNINKASIYRDIKQGYYGGITEVYKPFGNDLYYYDVNSLYPYVALQDMPGLECSKILYYTGQEEIDNLFGFYYCSIETPLNDYLGLLPVRSSAGLTFPLGKWEGWYFSEELKFAKENGYKIKVLKGYNFNRQADVFKDYISKVYEIKSNPINQSQKAMAKSLLNNLLGRFGISLEKPITEILSYKEFDNKMLMYKIMSYKIISDNKVLVTYIPKLDYEIINTHKLDFIKIANKYKDSELPGMNTTSIVISAAITAYARIHITKLKLEILRHGGELYYSDTDSIVTDIKLPDSMISNNELGKLKLEHEVIKGIFISGKFYCTLT